MRFFAQRCKFDVYRYEIETLALPVPTSLGLNMTEPNSQATAELAKTYVTLGCVTHVHVKCCA